MMYFFGDCISATNVQTMAARCAVAQMSASSSSAEVLYEYLRKIRVKTQKSAVRCAIPPSVMAGQEERPLGADFAGNPVSMATALGRVDAYA